MNDAPKRIWIDAWGGNWSSRGDGTQQIEYVRADIHRSLALDALAAETQAADAHAAQLKAEAMAAKLAEALRITREKLLITVHSEFDGVWSDADFSNETKEADAVLAEYEASK